MTEWQYPLRRGGSPDPKRGACLFDAVSWVVYGHLGDHPACVDKSLNSYGIQLNDWLPFAERQRLRRFIPLLAGTAAEAEPNKLADIRARFILQQANEIASHAGLRLMRARRKGLRPPDGVLLQPVEAYERALLCVTWSRRDELLFTPAIELLGRAIALGARANRAPIADTALDEAVERFRLARAA